MHLIPCYAKLQIIPHIDWERNTVVFRISSQNDIFGSQPFFVFKTTSGQYLWDNLDYGENRGTWSYIFDDKTFRINAIEKIVLAVNSPSGMTEITVYNVVSDETEHYFLNNTNAWNCAPNEGKEQIEKGTDIDMKKVLVTGADGFIGSHLTELLVKCGYDVKAFVYYNSFGTCGWIDTLTQEVRNGIEIFYGDIRDPNGVRKAVRGVEGIFHLAALIAIPFSYYSPDSYVDTNIKGTLNILQAARDFEISKTLITSTSEVYGTAQYVPIDEKHPFQGQSPYSATKIGADRLAESFYRSFNLPVSIVRPFNTYGPRQSARAVIPTIIGQLLAGCKEIKLGDLNPTRDFNYVADTVSGFREIYESVNTVGEEINIATMREISIGMLADEIIKQINPSADIICDKKRLRPEKSEVNRLLGSNEKIKRLTNWEPKYTLEQGLQETISWIETNLSYYKTDIYNI